MRTDSVANRKAALRRQINSSRAMLSPSERVNQDEARTRLVVGWVQELAATKVACYLSREPEPNTLGLVAKLLASGVRVLAPIVAKTSVGRWSPELGPGRKQLSQQLVQTRTGTEYNFVEPNLSFSTNLLKPPSGQTHTALRRTPVAPDWGWLTDMSRLEIGFGGIPNPDGLALGVAALAQVDAIIIPALAVDETGNRLGTGGGWYDQALAFASAFAPVAALLFNGEFAHQLPAEPHDRRVNLVFSANGVRNCDSSETN